MINRVLIRIKVIQILYSFLLVEKQFTLESRPSAPTKEKRFAYSLYLDMLVLMIKLSKRVEHRRNEFPLATTRFISRINLDDTVKSLLTRYTHEPFPYEGILDQLTERVIESGVYKNFLKDIDRNDPAAEENVWRNLFNLVIMTDNAVTEITSRRENYTLKGLERMKDMMETTFSNFLASQDNVAEVQKALGASLDKARELYFRLLWLPVELTEAEGIILDENRYKFLKTEEDINPNMRFVDNKVVASLRDNDTLRDYVEKNKLSWRQEDPLLVHKLLQSIKESEIYLEYMAAPFNDVRADGEFWRNIIRRVILPNTEFLEYLEEKSVFWNDDVDIISDFVGKSIRRVEDGDTVHVVLDKFKDEEDAMFGSELLRCIYRNKETYRGYINDALEGAKWDSERLAFMDIVILEAAIAEILNFPKIPLTVSVNEYIELAKSYSTHKSGQFVHGVLGNVISRLRSEGILFKN